MEGGLELMEGVALAAWLKSEGGTPTAPGALPADVSASVEAILERWGSLPSDARLLLLRRVAERIRPSIDAARAEACLPPRALALLASEAPLARGESWSRDAPSPRAGYVPDPGLIRHLQDAFTRREE